MEAAGGTAVPSTPDRARRSAITDADGGAPASALRPVVTFEPVAAPDAIGSPFACSWSCASAGAGTAIGGSAAPWNETWSFSAGL